MNTAYDLVALAAERVPDNLALVDDLTYRRVTYRELMQEIDAVATGFAARDIKPGTVVATALPNLWEHCIAVLALQRLGAVVALLNFRLNIQQLGRMIADAKATAALIRNDEQLAHVIAQSLPAGAPLWTIGGAAGPAEDFATCRSTTKPPEPHVPAPEDAAFMFYTSGTTGASKAAIIPHRATEPRITWISMLTSVRPDTDVRTLGAAPIFHAMGFFGPFMATLAYGGTFYIMSAFNPVEAVRLIDLHRITLVFAVPTMLQAIFNAPNYRPERCSSVRHAITGGSAVMPPLWRQLASDWPAQIMHGFGTTEMMCPLYSINPVERPRTVHKAYGWRVRVVAPGGDPDDIVKPGEVGEMILDMRNKCAFLGYDNAAETNAAKIRGGWYFTGDLALLNEDGSLDLFGRADDRIRSGAESIYPDEIESVLASHPEVKEICVVGVPDRLWGERVVACVIANEIKDWRRLDAHCLVSSLASFKRPRGYIFVPSIPRTATNKHDRKAVRDLIMNSRNANEEDEIWLFAA
jgi:acyl-CoA synthetase (AMP-forming)/AMP-acid ligase II